MRLSGSATTAEHLSFADARMALKLNGSSEHTMPAYSGKLVPTSAVQNEFAPTRYYRRVAYGEWGDFGSPADGMISKPVPVSTSGKCPRTYSWGPAQRRMGL